MDKIDIWKKIMEKEWTKTKNKWEKKVIKINIKIHIKKWETSTKFLKWKTGISERKHMLRKILNEEVDSHASQQDKNSMEGSGSEFSETEASS